MVSIIIFSNFMWRYFPKTTNITNFKVLNLFKWQSIPEEFNLNLLERTFLVDGTIN